MKITYKLVFTLLSFFIFSISFSQNTSEKSNDFDVIKLRSILKKRGVADKDLPKEMNAFRTRQQKINRAQKTKNLSNKKVATQKNTLAINSTNISTLRSAAASCVIDANERGGYIMLSNYEILVSTTPVTASLSGTYFPSNVYTYSWSLLDPQGALVSNSTDQNFTFTPSTLGEYTIELVLTDQNGCTTFYDNAVRSLDECGITENERSFGIMAPGDYSNSTTSLNMNQAYELTAEFWRTQNYSNLTFDWNLYSPNGTLITRGTSAEFPITLSVPGYHKVLLNVTDNLTGCKATNSKVIISLMSGSCTEENPKSEIVKGLLLNVVKKLAARTLMGETDQQINNNGPGSDFSSLLPYLKNNTGTSFYNYVSNREQNFNTGYLSEIKFSFSPDRQYDVRFYMGYGIAPFQPEYETVEELYERIEYELYLNTSQYISYNEQLNSCNVSLPTRMANGSSPLFDPDDCRAKSEIVNIDFCPSNCDPVTGIIKIIKDTGYPFQFSNSGITSVLACNETAFPNKFYANTQTLSIGTKLFANQSLSTPVPVSNSFAWYKAQDNTVAYKIDATGKITDIYSCSTSTCDKRFLDYVTVVAQEPITLNYFLPNGTEVNKTFEPVPRGGDQTYTFSVAACISETSLTIDGPVLNKTVAWNDNQNCCQTAMAKAFRFSTPGRDSASEACPAITFPDTFYAASNSLGIGTQLYLDAQLKNKVGSGNTWRKEGIDGYTIRIANDGTVAEFSNCGVEEPTTTTYGYRAMHPYEHTGTDYVIYIDANGVQRQIDLPRAGAGEDIETAPCVEIVARSIVTHAGVTTCTP
ncbi:hypothetical protein [Flavobacterium sp. KACC 22763]|uniref:hypothetical protein n=1 Tax=Flavobacterium sp. KACC 22763 TaxID=3025668 RepID=UPI002365A0B8|nr:hypothetical protein [Flavobacterium sp. KACC 22763]WDF66484.1 hypothetical protein PQ463_10005 [Flavobacterium sp. KACC 22763]